MRLTALALCFALLALASCATLSEDACRQGAWDSIGLQDGSRGRADTFIGSHAEACAEYGITPDVAAWRAGREQGLGLYCTPSNAYDLGTRGSQLNAVCESYDQVTLNRANREGLYYYEINREIRMLESEIDEGRATLDALSEEKSTKQTRRAERYIEDDIRDAQRELRFLALDRLGYRRPY